MSDVRIIFPNSKAPLAERLREAIAHAGYAVEPGGGVAPGETPAAAEAQAVLLLWDRTSIAQPGLQQAAAAARNRGRAIDVSADGITPIGLADESRLIQLSAWRGEPHHPGWKKIIAELERLCGGHRSAAAPARHAASHAPGPAAARAGRAGGGGAKLAVIGVAIVVALMLVGFLAMSRRSLEVGGTPQAAKPAVAAAQPMAAPDSGTLPAAAPPAVSGDSEASAPPAQGAGEATAGVSPGTPQMAQAGQPALASTNGSASDRAPRAATRPRAAPQRLPGVVRYTKYAKTMRLFCQRSGRHTPQCRLFNANLANARR